MAKTINIFPASDISIEHSKYPTSTANAYALINDETSDDDTSYITHNLTTSSANITSTFKCDNTELTGKIYLTGISSLIRSRYQSSNAEINSPIVRTSVSINSGSSVNSSNITPTNSYATNTYTYQTISGLNTIYNSINDANIVIGIYTSGSYTSGGGKTSSSASIRVTQANITITYLDVFDCAAELIPGTGIASVSCSNPETVDGNTCTFTATLENNIEFVGWFSDEEGHNLVSTDRVYTTTISENTTLYAKGSVLYNIDVYADENCTVASSASSALYGTDVTVTAIPNSSRYTFVGWYSNPERTNLISEENPYTFNVQTDTVLYAKTKINQVLYVKVNGIWVPFSKAYKKINGEWVEQTDFTGLFDTSKNYVKKDI